MSVPAMGTRHPTHGQDGLAELIIALLYSRVSTDEQAKEGVSLDEQDAANRGYVAARPRWAVGGEYRDVQSGMKPSREGYQQMLHEVRRLRASRSDVVVVVKFQDRLGRDFEESIRAYFELVRLGVDVHIVDRQGAPSEDEFFLRAYIAHQESRNTGRRVKSAIKQIEARGWHKPGGAPWGYRLREATDAERREGAPKRVLELDPSCSEDVAEAWARLAGGDSMRQIATWVRTLPATVRGGRDLSFQAVRRMLRAPVYVGRHGHFVDDDPDAVLERPVGRWPALIDDDTWRQATHQRQLAVRMPKQARGEYPLTGLLRCSRCGGRMSGRANPQRPRQPARREYICYAKTILGAKNLDRPCSMTLRAEAIEQPVMATLVRMLRAAGRPQVRSRIVREVARLEAAEAAEPLGRKVTALEGRRKRALDRLDALMDLRADGEIDADEYARSAARYREEKERIEAELVEVRGRVRSTQAAPVSLVLPSCTAWADTLERADVGSIREVLGLFFETVAPVRVARGVYEPDYSWTATGHAVLSAALVALSGERDAESAAFRTALVRVDNLARAKWSTLTDASA